MDIEVNGESRSIPKGATLRDLLDTMEIGVAGVAVAVNHEVVSRGQLGTHLLSRGDRVEIVRAVGGG